jgi:hypothetical protein
MDAARALLAKADAASARSNARAKAEATIQDWWGQRRTDDHEPRSGNEVNRTGIGADRRLSLATALAGAIAVLVLLPARFSLGPRWLIPGLEVLLLIAIFAADHYRTDRRSAVVRALSFALVLVLVVAAAFITGRLVVDLVEGGPETNSPADLLEVGFGVWAYAIIAFAFLYWLLAGADRKRASPIPRSSRTWRSLSSSTRQ